MCQGKRQGRWATNLLALGRRAARQTGSIWACWHADLGASELAGLDGMLVLHARRTRRASADIGYSQPPHLCIVLAAMAGAHELKGGAHVRGKSAAGGLQWLSRANSSGLGSPFLCLHRAGPALAASTERKSGVPPPPPAQLLITLFSAAFQGTTQPRWVQMELTPAACAATRSSVCVAFCEEACLHGSLLLPSDPDMTASGTVDAYHTSPDPSLPLLGTSGLPASGTGSVNATH